MLRSIALGGVAVGACVAAGIAVLAPTRVFDVVLAELIGQPGQARTTIAQRLVAVVGVILGALAIASVVARPAARRLPAKPRRVVIVLAVVLAGLAALNALVLAQRRGALRDIVPPDWAYTTLAVAVALGASWFLAIREPDTGTRTRGGSAWAAAAGGAGYGCFSGLWHCCAPLWGHGTWTNAAIDLLWFAALAVTLGAIGRVAASLRVGLGEVLGALLFGLAYPWHTPVFFAQNLVGGAFATALVRVTASGWAPVLFLGTAYLTHTTLPFLGPLGVVVAFALLAVCVARAPRGWLQPARATI